MIPLFKKTKELEQNVEQFLNIISESILHFQEGVESYLENKEQEFEERLEAVRTSEQNADKLRRDIETYLYVNTLIPESRGDVLALLETIDQVINRTKETLLEFSVECPQISNYFKEGYLDLSKYVVEAVEAMVRASRAFFRDVNTVKDHLHKVMYYETEADRCAGKLKRKIFSSDLELSHKIHLRYFALHIDLIADYAEDVADRLAVYTIKRSI